MVTLASLLCSICSSTSYLLMRCLYLSSCSLRDAADLASFLNFSSSAVSSAHSLDLIAQRPLRRSISIDIMASFSSILSCPSERLVSAYLTLWISISLSLSMLRYLSSSILFSPVVFCSSYRVCSNFWLLSVNTMLILCISACFSAKFCSKLPLFRLRSSSRRISLLRLSLWPCRTRISWFLLSSWSLSCLTSSCRRSLFSSAFSLTARISTVTLSRIWVSTCPVRTCFSYSLFSSLALHSAMSVVNLATFFSACSLCYRASLSSSSNPSYLACRDSKCAACCGLFCSSSSSSVCLLMKSLSFSFSVFRPAAW